jgi:hypothetical protein
VAFTSNSNILRVSNFYLKCDRHNLKSGLPVCFSKYRLHNKVGNLPPDEPCRGVSILKPLMGVDNNLLTNLETFFTMNYPIVSCIMFLLCLQAVTTISYSMNSCFV